MPSPLVALLSLAMATSVSSVSRPAGPGGPVALADSVVIEKRAHRLTLYHLGVPMRRYRVALGGQPVGDKVSAGDRRTPEGMFAVEDRNPLSDFGVDPSARATDLHLPWKLAEFHQLIDVGLAHRCTFFHLLD